MPMIVFNPHSWPATGAVSLPHPIAVATDAQRATRPRAADPLGRGDLQPDPQPPPGHRACPRLPQVLAPCRPTRPGATGSRWRNRRPPREDGILANGLVRVEVDMATGRLVQMVAGALGLPGGAEVLAGAVRPVLVVDASDTWSHGVDRYAGDEEEGRLVSTAGWSRRARSAPRRAASGRSAAGGPRWPRRCPSTRVRPRWRCVSTSTGTRLIACSSSSSPSRSRQPASVAGAAYGSVERPCSGHEEPMVHWVDLADASAGWGLACAIEGAGGYDALGSTLRVTVLRSPRVADHGLGWGEEDRAGYPFTDQGRHRRRYRLVPHLGPARAAQLPQRAAEHRIELPVVLDTWHRGRLGPEGSAAHLEGGGTIMPVLKRAEDGWRHRGPPVGGRPASASASASPSARASRGPSPSGRASSGPTRCARSSSPTTTRPGPGRWASPSSTCSTRPGPTSPVSSPAIRTSRAWCPR